MELMLVPPPWLEQLLSTTFFSVCKAHINAPRNECNMYCLDCRDQSFCFYCKHAWHDDHQIRRSSYHDVVRVAEIQKVLDISGVQTYVINSARVLFLNERPQNQVKTNNGVISGSKTNPHLCEICKRNLLDPFRFCSLGCKLVGIKKNGNASFILSAKKDEEIGKIEEGRGRLRLVSKEELIMREGIHKQLYQSTSSPYCPRSSQQACSNSRRRKGIPHRAPLGP
ncbi:protein RGF1 INDUCIBLE TRANSCRIPTION FACTOR 1 isoform X2 [Cicer arietinum]|uniref:protein RGF1 INDUCIBLE TRANSCRIPTION FACTOR 1 isoform X2 n=1 Tax=Cicer arietinum TaxID=3827 RepID=UPI003CC65540